MGRTIEIEFPKRKFKVTGTSVVPVQFEVIVEADSSEHAVLELFHDDRRWKAGIKMDTASRWNALEAFEAVAEEIKPEGLR
jgi:hypothetical protein